MFFVGSINKIFEKGENRSVRLKKNIIISFSIKALSLAINLSVIPLMIEYVDPVKYGIWVTLTSIISWFSFFDFGMGNGLRNNLTTVLALNEVEKAKKYVSTTYAIFVLLAVSFFVLFYFINPRINWNDLLKIPSTIDENIHLVLLIALGTFCIQFIAQLLNTVLISLQQPAKAEFITFLGQLVLLITLVVLKYTVKGSLLILVIASNITPIIIFLASLLFYSGKLKMIAPAFKSIDFRYTKSIMNIGGVFFLIQIGAMILLQTDIIIITRVLGPESVTKFNVAYKLYLIIIMGFSIVVMPYWSAFTEAYAKKDYSWIEGSVKKLRKLWLLTSFVVTPIFFTLSKFLFKIWLPAGLDISFGLSVVMALYAVGYTCLLLNCYFLNGVGKLRVQLLLYAFVSITNIPLGIAMGKLWGIEGVVIANIISFVLMNLVLWIQTNKILRNKASGIWNL